MDKKNEELKEMTVDEMIKQGKDVDNSTLHTETIDELLTSGKEE